MKLLKLIKYDIKMGFLYNKYKFIALIALLFAICFAFRVDALKFTELEKFTYGDYILYTIEGARQLTIEEMRNYIIPAMWIGIQVLIGYIVGYYAVDDLHTYGQQILIRSGSRIKWWLSKCVWNICMIILVYILVYSVSAIFCVISGDELNIVITQECIVNRVFKTSNVNVNSNELKLMLFIMPVIVSMTVSMLQMTLSLIISPIIGFIVVQVILFGSTLLPNKMLLGNYSMFAKNEICGMTDINIYEGIIINVMLFVVSIITGFIYFNARNILSRE